MRLDVRTILVLVHPDGQRVLLLRRSPYKKLFPGLITGIGGAVELGNSEGDNLEASLWREFGEETRIPREHVTDVRLRLSTLLSRDQEQVVLLWFLGNLTETPTDLSCTEGMLGFFDRTRLPLTEMIPTAREAIQFILALPAGDTTIYNGVYEMETMRLIVSCQLPLATC